MTCIPGLIALALPLLVDEQTDQWIEVLRDAQLANQALVRQGHSTMHIEYVRDVSDRDRTKIEFEAEVTWRDEDYLEKVRAIDKEGVLFGFPTEGPLENLPWFLIMQTNDGFHTFNPEQKFLRFTKDSKYDRTEIVVHPKYLWFACCPPMGEQGRPWPEMIGPMPASRTGGKLGKVEFIRLPENRIRRIRRDPHGGVMDTVFSLDDAANPVSSSYVEPGRDKPISAMTWEWRKQGEAVVLHKMHLTRSLYQVKEGLEEEYHLNVLKVDLAPVSQSTFTRQHLLTMIPADSSLEEREEGRPPRIRRLGRITDAELKSLGQKLKSRGFLNQ